MNVMKYAIKITGANNITDIKDLITGFIRKETSAKLSVFNSPEDEIVFFAKDNSVYYYILFISKIYTDAFLIMSTLTSKEKTTSIISNGENIFDITERVV